jgi:hypothetical protein
MSRCAITGNELNNKEGDVSPAAFPTIGRKMRAMNSLLMWLLEATPSMESTRILAVIATIWSPRLILWTNHDSGQLTDNGEDDE